MKWIPEPKPPSGGLAAEGFYKLLGRPRLDPLTVLVRETAQNSWDARSSDTGQVKFAIDGVGLSDDQQSTLSNEVFPGSESAVGTNLHKRLSEASLFSLIISDRGTKGLSGPLTADTADSDQTYDWVDFVLNVGEANTQGRTGGTYGFGKTISYVVSSANSVVIYSRTRYRGRLESRLIACAIGDKFARESKLFTGRHWWGAHGESAPIPVVGDEADRIASMIGMRTLADQETGTSILIVAPDLGGRTRDQAMRFIAESVTWHLWPKLMARSGAAPMEIAIRMDGTPIDIPRPEDRPPLHGFVQAFRALLDGAEFVDSSLGVRVDDIRCQRPKALVGQLATVPLIYRERVHVDDGADDSDPDAPRAAASITGVSHHVALLRSPELVVEYLEGPPPPEGGTEWAGVFRSYDEYDHHFAASEPPTHDNWNPDLLPRSPGRTIVNVALREIKQALENRWSKRRKASHAAISSTALVADQLSHLAGALPARGSGRRRRETGPQRGGRAASKPKVELVSSTPTHNHGRSGTSAVFLVQPSQAATLTRVRFSVAAALEGAAGDSDLDPELSLVEAWLEGSLMDVSGHAGELEFKGRNPVELRLVAARGLETSVLFDVDAEGVQ